MSVISQENCLKTLSATIQKKVFNDRAASPLLEELRELEKRSMLLALAGSVLDNSEEIETRRLLADFFSAQIIEIADNESKDAHTKENRETVARSKLKIEVRKWLMTQLAPNAYGNRPGRQAVKAAGPTCKTIVYLPENDRN
ncbi:MAG: hypothetical protein ABJN40_12920 [Sneathiella sp.]